MYVTEFTVRIVINRIQTLPEIIFFHNLTLLSSPPKCMAALRAVYVSLCEVTFAFGHARTAPIWSPVALKKGCGL